MYKKFLKAGVIALSIMGMAAFAGCGNKDNDSVESVVENINITTEEITTEATTTEVTEEETTAEVTEEETTEVTTEEATEGASEDESGIPNAYKEVIQRYIDTIEVGESMDEDIEKYDLTMVIMYSDDSLAKIGYTVLDVNNDGLEELLIGSVLDGTSVIYDIYTIENGEAKKLLPTGWERNVYSLSDDGRIMNFGSSGASDYQILVYEISGTKAVFSEGIRLLGDRIDYDIIHYMNLHSDIIDDPDYDEISEDEFSSREDKYYGMKTSKEIIPFLNFVD